MRLPIAHNGRDTTAQPQRREYPGGLPSLPTAAAPKAKLKASTTRRGSWGFGYKKNTPRFKSLPVEEDLSHSSSRGNDPTETTEEPSSSAHDSLRSRDDSSPRERATADTKSAITTKSKAKKSRKAKPRRQRKSSIDAPAGEEECQFLEVTDESRASSDLSFRSNTTKDSSLSRSNRSNTIKKDSLTRASSKHAANSRSKVTTRYTTDSSCRSNTSKDSSLSRSHRSSDPPGITKNKHLKQATTPSRLSSSDHCTPLQRERPRRAFVRSASVPKFRWSDHQGDQESDNIPPAEFNKVRRSNLSSPGNSNASPGRRNRRWLPRSASVPKFVVGENLAHDHHFAKGSSRAAKHTKSHQNTSPEDEAGYTIAHKDYEASPVQRRQQRQFPCSPPVPSFAQDFVHQVDSPLGISAIDWEQQSDIENRHPNRLGAAPVGHHASPSLPSKLHRTLPRSVSVPKLKLLGDENDVPQASPKLKSIVKKQPTQSQASHRPSEETSEFQILYKAKTREGRRPSPRRAIQRTTSVPIHVVSPGMLRRGNREAQRAIETSLIREAEAGADEGYATSPTKNQHAVSPRNNDIHPTSPRRQRPRRLIHRSSSVPNFLLDDGLSLSGREEQRRVDLEEPATEETSLNSDTADTFPDLVSVSPPTSDCGRIVLSRNALSKLKSPPLYSKAEDESPTSGAKVPKSPSPLKRRSKKSKAPEFPAVGPNYTLVVNHDSPDEVTCLTMDDFEKSKTNRPRLRGKRNDKQKKALPKNAVASSGALSDAGLARILRKDIHSKKEPVLVAALVAIKEYASKGSKQRAKICTFGAIPSILRVMDNNKTATHSILLSALGALEKVAYKDAKIQETACELGAIPTIVRVVQRSLSQAKVVLAACKTLDAITAYLRLPDAEAQDKYQEIDTKGAMTVLTCCLLAHSKDKDIAAYGVGTITNICTYRPPEIQMLSAAGGIAVLESALQLKWKSKSRKNQSQADLETIAAFVAGSSSSNDEGEDSSDESSSHADDNGNSIGDETASCDRSFES